MRQNELGAEQAVRARYEEQREMDRLAIHEQACVRAIETHCGGRPELVEKLVFIVRGVTRGDCNCKDLGGDGLTCDVCDSIALIAQLPEASK